MFDLKDIPLSKYTRKEDIVNCVTHALGVPFCVVAAVMLFSLISGRTSGRIIFSTALYLVSMFSPARPSITALSPRAQSR